MARKSTWILPGLRGIGGGNQMKDHRVRRSSRQKTFTCEMLEDRVVLHGGGIFGNFGFGPGAGNFLAQALNAVGVETSPVGNIQGGIIGRFGPSGSQNTALTTLQTAERTLQTELQSLASKSGLTLADLSKLAADSQKLLSDGVTVNAQSLQTAVKDLASGSANGAGEFTAAITGGNSSAAADVQTALTDVQKAITDSGVMSTDIGTVATDQQAIQTDLSNLTTGGGRFFGRFFGGFVNTYSFGPGGNGGFLAQALNAVGIVTTPVSAPQGGIIGRFGTTSTLGTLINNLQTAQHQLQTDEAAVAGYSGVTVGDLTRLTQDSQNILNAGVTVNAQALQTAVKDLAAGNTATGTSEFTAAFTVPASSTTGAGYVSQALTDVQTTIADSHETAPPTGQTVSLTTIQTDQANIQAAQTALQNARNGGTSTTGASGNTGTTGFNFGGFPFRQILQFFAGRGRF